MSLPRFSPDDVRDLWQFLGRQFGFEVTTKNDPRAVQIWSLLVKLGKASVVDPRDWRERFATYLPPEIAGESTVFLPFTPGEPTTLWPLDAQFLVAPHEAQHAAQYRLDPSGFLLLFALSTADRANYERAARATAECVRWALGGELADPKVATASLVTSYGCLFDDAAVAAEDLRLDEETIRAGGIVSMVAALVIEWWKRRPGDPGAVV